MLRRISLAVMTLLFGPPASCAASGPQPLAARIASAQDGAVIALPPGPAGVLQLDGVRHARPVTIRSADPTKPVIFSGLNIANSDNLILQDVQFDLPAYDGPPDAKGQAAEMVNALQILKSTNIRIEHVTVEGPSNATLATETSGLLIRSSNKVAVVNSVFRRLHNAIGHLDNDGLEIRDNRFEDLADDGVRGGGSSNVQIVGNQFGSLHSDAADLDHPDCIQFWTSNTKESAHDITVEGNLCLRGSGRSVQGIFFGNEAHIPYRNLIIRDNVLVGTGYNGLVAADVDGAQIEGNVVARFPDITTRLRVLDSRNVTVTNNRAAEYGWTANSRIPQTNTNLVDRNNKTIGTVTDHGVALASQWQNQARPDASTSAEKASQAQP
jgi:hypothetical protein